MLYQGRPVDRFVGPMRLPRRSYAGLALHTCSAHTAEMTPARTRRPRAQLPAPVTRARPGDLGPRITLMISPAQLRGIKHVQTLAKREGFDLSAADVARAALDVLLEEVTRREAEAQAPRSLVEHPPEGWEAVRAEPEPEGQEEG
jgi:hypothetical protein